MNYDVHTNGIRPLCFWRRAAATDRSHFQILLTMKLTAFFLAFLALQVTARVSGQTLSLTLKNAPFKKAIEEIGRQTSYDFSYSDEILKLAKPVSVNLRNVPLEVALKDIFSKQVLTYEIADKIIIIRQKHAIPARSPDAGSRQNISGQVLDNTGRPLENVTVAVKGTSLETFTNAGGRYTLADVPDNAVLQFRYVGFDLLEIVADRPIINVILNPAVSTLEEIVISKGYYTTTKELNTGSVSTVTAKEISGQPITNPVVALQGRVSGMYISQSSGVPGSGINVQLRGRNSIANGNEPLYVVDGVPFPSSSLANMPSGAYAISPFNSINMDNIESFEILKDADATAIYGSRGANGVVLITTKKGSSGKTKVDLNINSGISSVPKKLDLLNTEQYVAMRNEAFNNDGAKVGNTDYDMNGAWGDINRYTDWQEVLVGKNASMNNAMLNISGGSQQTQFVFGGSYRRETTVFPGDFANRKIGSHFNISHQSENKRFRAVFGGTYTIDNNRLPIDDFTSKILLAPNTPNLFNSDGSLNWQNSTWENPLAILRQTSTSESYNLNSTLSLSYELTRGLQIKSRFGYNDMNMNQKVIIPSTSYNPTLNQDILRQNRMGTGKNRSLIAEPSMNYNLTTKYGKIESLLGLTFQRDNLEQVQRQASGFSSDALIDNIGAATTVRLTGFVSSVYKYNAIFARIGYSYDNKYLLNITGRRDGSSRFGAGKQFGNFGAIGAAWVFSKENFIKETMPFLSYGKIRTSYGITGNDQLGNYQFLSTYTSSTTTYQGTAGLSPTRHSNSDYGWENVKKWELALETGFLNNGILFNIGSYRNRTTNQLVGYALPAYTGFNTVKANLPAIIENTGIEADITTKIIDGQKFKWSVSANLTVPKNKLVSYPNLATSTYAQTYIIGQPIMLRRMYTYTGIDPTTGLYSFKDFNQDGAVIYADDAKPKFMGQKYFGGMSNSLSYKGFQLDFLFQFVKQNGFRFDANIVPGAVDVTSNISKSVYENRSTNVTPNKLQKLTQNFSSTISDRYYTYYRQSDGVVGDASFIRMKNVSLSYLVKQNHLRSLGISNLRIYFLGQNLFTITSYDGLDPENSYLNVGILNLPPLRVYTIGVQLTI